MAKVFVVGAVEVMPKWKSAKWRGSSPNLMAGPLPKHRGGHGRGIVAGRLCLQVIPNRRQRTLVAFVSSNAHISVKVKTDAWIGYEPLAEADYNHEPVAVRGDHAKTAIPLPVIHIAFGNSDAWLLRTRHGKPRILKHTAKGQFRMKNQMLTTVGKGTELG